MTYHKPVPASRLDHPSVTSVLFHPRPDLSQPMDAADIEDHWISVEASVNIGARFHLAPDKGAPAIIFFHGNGEIVSDYDGIAPAFTGKGLHFMAVDYRGYGNSDGVPSVAAMMTDCQKIFDYCQNWLATNAFYGPVVIMGRSLGSVSALEVASRRPTEIDGLVIESGLAYTMPLLRLLGVRPEALGITEADGFDQLGKINRYTGPVLILHAAFDHIIPFSDAQALYDNSGSVQKELVKIPNADHNDILFRGGETYLAAVRRLADNALRT